ncbi:hypothetical protein D7Z54_07515 [Salibacterium salarium]|uniref:Uncharacterized protein n=1 Tax=Salibacterium salarium TaxID=284579 RepID=A0A428N6G3_9BACI|nr:DUF5367 domain-containing protein [Salibacterium salarium]RSL33956.1 hypothetical protein D7Z54_07515 [Salibacterium salarium]
MFFLIWGFLVWFSASAIFRFTGQFFFSYENPMLLVTSYILVVPLIAVLTLPIYQWKNVNADKRLKAAVFIALPGMFIDAIVLIYFSDVFINLDTEVNGMFGSWLLWAYSLILLTGFIPGRKLTCE